MLGTYRSLFRAPGATAFSLVGFVARLPISMMGIGTVLLVSGSTGRYTLAGLVAATLGLATAIGGPAIARLIDRRGQARLLRPVLVVHAVSVVGLVLAVTQDAPTWTWFAAALLAGASTTNIGSLVRARWAHALPAGPPRQTAFAFESVVDEIIFVTGPPLVTWLAIGISYPAGLLAAVSFALVGGLGLAALRRTEPPVHTGGPAPGLRQVLGPGLLVVALTFFGAGTVFGSIEVIVVAYADFRAHPAAAGGILAAYAGGSLIAGLGYGVVRWRAALPVRFVLASAAFGTASLLLLVVDSLPVLAVVMFVAGSAISPVLISGNALVESLMPPGALTQGLTWVSTGIVLGVTLGAALSGPVIDAFGAQRAFLIPMVAGVSTIAITLAGRRWLAPRRSVMLDS